MFFSISRIAGDGGDRAPPSGSIRLWNRGLGDGARAILVMSFYGSFAPMSDSQIASPYPIPVPLERFMVQDGVLLNAERWHLTQEYHRRRQNLHFQSLHRGGVVYGLGVRPMEPPPQVTASHRDGRWLEIQPGLAIDDQGNPIVVAQPLAFHLVSVAKDRPVLVYLVISYVDPSQLQRSQYQEIVQETFRVREQHYAPTDRPEGALELCRLWLAPDTPQLRSPQCFYLPQPGDVDLRFRPVARPKAQGWIRAIQFTDTADPPFATAVTALFAASPVLYPLQDLGPVTWAPLAAAESFWPGDRPYPYNLVLLTYGDLLTLMAQGDPDRPTFLTTHIQQGGAIWVELLNGDSLVDELSQVIQELERALGDIGDNYALQGMRRELEQEVDTARRALTVELGSIIEDLHALAIRLGLTAPQLTPVDYGHPLLGQPFLFTHPPEVQGKPVVIYAWGPLMLVMGDLSLAWRPAPYHRFSRETIRSAQEMGLNLLHYAWQYHHLSQIQGGEGQ